MAAALMDRRVSARIVVTAAGVLACVTAAAPPGPGSPVRAVVLGIVATGLVTGAVLTRSASAVRATAVVAAVIVILIGGAWLEVAPAVVAVALGVVPLLVLASLGRRPAWGPALRWLRVGLLTPSVWALAVVTTLAAVAALTLFALLARPEVSSYLMMLRSMPVWLAALGVVGFALVNPVWEEVLYRGVLQHELGLTVGPWPAVVVQAVLFGLSHLYGFPSGWLGVAMATAWGLGLGVIRLRTGGIVVPYLVHVGANLTIGMLAVVSLR